MGCLSGGCVREVQVGLLIHTWDRWVALGVVELIGWLFGGERGKGRSLSGDRGKG